MTANHDKQQMLSEDENENEEDLDMFFSTDSIDFCPKLKNFDTMEPPRGLITFKVTCRALIPTRLS